jgi:hypothetical protein
MKVVNILIATSLAFMAVSCTQNSEQITRTYLVGSWEEINEALLDSFPVGEILNFAENGDFTLENSYLSFDSPPLGNWEFNEINNQVTYTYGGDTLQGVPTISYMSTLDIVTLEGNKMKVKYQQKEGIAKFVRPERVYQKRE